MNSITRGRCPRSLRLGALAFIAAWLGFSASALAVCNEGCAGFGSTFLGNDTGFVRYSTAIGANVHPYRKFNTANGANALSSETSFRANSNVAEGSSALFSNQDGVGNMANGSDALHNNISGNRNVAAGYTALFSNEAGNRNTSVGFRALYQNSGSNNTALGFNAGSNLIDGSSNVYIGYNVVGLNVENNTTRIGNIYSSLASARPVYIDSDNKIGTLVSSRRFKENIKPMDKASEAILSLKPVTFRYKKEIEPSSPLMFGLTAEDVEKVNPELVIRDGTGHAQTVRYDAVNAMLLNEFLKQHRQVEEQDRKLEEQERTISRHETEIRALASRIQNASAEVQSIKSTLPVIALSE